MTSGKRDEMITLIACTIASGPFRPLMLIFARDKNSALLKIIAAQDCSIEVTPSGSLNDV